MNTKSDGFRIFVLGAGFSVPAGLPMGNDLFNEVRLEIENNHGTDTKFHDSINEFIDYKREADGDELTIDDVNLEEFMSYLDIEHFLGLKGSDTFSENGNGAQLFVKRYIGKIIHKKTPSSDKLPNEYYEFAENLSVNDIVITLNYDIVLERALEHVGKPYRLFPNRYESIGETGNIVDDSIKELKVFKLHGSLDWFSNKSFLWLLDSFKKSGSSLIPRDVIFKDENTYQPYPLVDGVRNENDPLINIFRLKNIDSFYNKLDPPAIPMILSPSHVKIVYASSFKDFWYGLGEAGAFNLGLSIIGFSLPKHDEYLKVTLFKLVSNYQDVSWDEVIFDKIKDYVKIVDYRKDKESINDLKNSYRFVNSEKSQYYLNGFSSEAVRFLFTNERSE